MPINPTNLHYRTSFDITPSKPSDNAWGKLISEIRRWMKGKASKGETVYGSWLYYGNIGHPKTFKPGIKITAASNIGRGTQNAPEFWAVQFEEPDKEHPGIRRWKTDIGISIRENGRYEFSLIVSSSIMLGYIGKELPIPSPTTPHLVSNFLSGPNWYSFAGEEKLSRSPLILCTGEVPNFINKLESSSRLCPIVYVSRDYYTNEPLVDVYRLAKVLAGNAVVYVSETNLLDKETEYFFPQYFRCWNGMIRVYQPRVDFSSQHDSSRHRYFKTSEIETYTSDGVINMLVKGISRRSIQWKKPKITSLSDISSIYRSQKIVELSANKEKIKAEEWLEELETLMDENDGLKKNNDQLEEQIFTLEEKVDEKERELSRKDFERLESLKTADKSKNSLEILESKLKKISDLTKLPKNLIEAIDLIEGIHSENIIFTELSKKTAKEASWLSIDIGWPCLWSVATTLHSLFFEESEHQIDLEKEFKERSGFELAMTEGKQTKRDQKLRRKRKIKYKGKQFDIGPHIKYGNKKPKLLRVYFCPDSESKKIIVGHCGDHLETFSSQFRK